MEGVGQGVNAPEIETPLGFQIFVYLYTGLTYLLVIYSLCVLGIGHEGKQRTKAMKKNSGNIQEHDNKNDDGRHSSSAAEDPGVSASEHYGEEQPTSSTTDSQPIRRHHSGDEEEHQNDQPGLQLEIPNGGNGEEEKEEEVEEQPNHTSYPNSYPHKIPSHPAPRTRVPPFMSPKLPIHPINRAGRYPHQHHGIPGQKMMNINIHHPMMSFNSSKSKITDNTSTSSDIKYTHKSKRRKISTTGSVASKRSAGSSHHWHSVGRTSLLGPRSRSLRNVIDRARELERSERHSLAGSSIVSGSRPGTSVAPLPVAGLSGSIGTGPDTGKPSVVNKSEEKLHISDAASEILNNTDPNDRFLPTMPVSRPPTVRSYHDGAAESVSKLFDEISLSPSQVYESPVIDLATQAKQYHPVTKPKPSWLVSGPLCCLEPWLELAEPEYEMSLIFRLSVPTTLAALSEPMFRAILTAIISHLSGTESMVAYLLVTLLLRMTTEEISEAISQAQSAMVREVSIFANGTPSTVSASTEPTSTATSYKDDPCYVVGQLIQLSIILHILLGGTLFALWFNFMDDVVRWLVQTDKDAETIATSAQQYTRVILVQYMIQALTKAFMVVFENCAREPFETVIDILSTMMTIVTIIIIFSVADENDHVTDLQKMAYAQVVVAAAASVTKMSYVILKGWMENYSDGLLKNVAIRNNTIAFRSLICGALTYFLGSFMEIGEVDVLTLFVRGLGPGAVKTWALVGLIWKILESSMEGMVEAASVRIALLLSHYQPVLAQRLSTKVLYHSIIISLLITGVLLYALGSLLVHALTVDPNLQQMLNDLIYFIGIATISMGYSQASWSIIEAQGRVNTNFFIVMIRRWIVTIPLSIFFIFSKFESLPWDLNAVTGALVIGHDTASVIYAYVVLKKSDWAMIIEEPNPISGDEPEPDEIDNTGAFGVFPDIDSEDSSNCIM